MHPAAPGFLVVFSAFVTNEKEIFAELPPFLDKSIPEPHGIVDNVMRILALQGAYIKPDFLIWFEPGSADLTKNGAVGPPHRGRHDNQLTKNIRILETEIKTHEAAKRGAAKTSASTLRHGTVLTINEWFEILDEKATVIARAAAVAGAITHRRVLGYAFHPAVINSDDNEGLYLATLNQFFRDFS